MDALARDIGGDDAVRSIGRVRRYWWLVLLGALIGLVGGAAAVSAVPKQYTSTATVLVYPPPDQATLTTARLNSSVNMDNELQFIASVEVGKAAKELLRTETDLDVLQQQLTAVVPANTSVIDVSFSGGTPEKAQQYAHAFAQAYINVRTDQAKAAIAGQEEALTGQLTALQKTLAKYTAISAGSATTAPEHVNAAAQINILQQSISSVNSRLSPLSTVNPTAGAIIDDAALPTSPTKPIPPLYVGTGIFVGLMFGLALALLAALLDKRVRSAEDVEQRGGFPVITSIPRPGRGKAQAAVLTARTGSGEFDRLRLRLDSATPDRSSSVVVTGVQGGYSAGFVAANLAVSMARSGSEVILVCADGDSPAAAMLGLADGPGLAGALLEGRSLAEVTEPVAGRPRLSVVTPGKDLADVLDRVPVQQVTALVDALVQSGHRVVLEAPPVSQGTDAQELARRAGSALVVVELGVSRLPAVRNAFEELERAGALVPGAVVVPSVTVAPRGVGREGAERVTAETAAQSRS